MDYKVGAARRSEPGRDDPPFERLPRRVLGLRPLTHALQNVVDVAEPVGESKLALGRFTTVEMERRDGIGDFLARAQGRNFGIPWRFKIERQGVAPVLPNEVDQRRGVRERRHVGTKREPRGGCVVVASPCYGTDPSLRDVPFFFLKSYFSSVGFTNIWLNTI